MKLIRNANDFVGGFPGKKNHSATDIDAAYLLHPA